MRIRADFSEAKKDIAALSKLDSDFQKRMEEWKNESVRQLKFRARGMRKSYWRKSGHLALSTNGRVLRTPTGLRIILGSGVFAPEVPYAVLQEEGGTIRPKRAKWLAIPFRGVKGFPREYNDTFFARSKRGNLIMFQKRGKDKEPLFAMKKEVKVQASRWFSSVIGKQKEKLAAMLSENNILARLGVIK
jgi:hypothetical protein